MAMNILQSGTRPANPMYRVGHAGGGGLYNGYATPRAKQRWEVDQIVNVGFVKGLVVKARVATPGDCRPDIWALWQPSTNRFYQFQPHLGLSRVDGLTQAMEGMIMATIAPVALPGTLPAALALFHEQCEQIEAATDQDEIDRLVRASQDLLIHLSGLTASTASLLAATMDAIISRHADFGTADLDFLRDARNDACQLVAEPAFAASLGPRNGAIWAAT